MKFHGFEVISFCVIHEYRSNRCIHGDISFRYFF